jgi:hypothetical protein
MLRATHSAGFVVPKPTVATAQDAAVRIAVRGLFCGIYGERLQVTKERNQKLRIFQHAFYIQSAWADGEKLDTNIKKIVVYSLIFASHSKPGFCIA